MAKKQYFCVIDTETTQKGHVADFAAVIVDRKGNIYNQCAVLLKRFYGNEDLFYNPNDDSKSIWSVEGLKRRTDNYNSMIEQGTRTLATVTAVNRWLDRAALTYPNIKLTAYNLAFDVDKCKNSGIDLTMFKEKFCLWYAFNHSIANNKKYIDFCLQNKRLTEKLNFKTDAETAAGFITGAMLTEPHTALEDIIDFELPILQFMLKKRKIIEKPYNWRDWQLAENVKPA